MVRERLPDLDFDQYQIATICDLIMATKVPQNPKTLLEKIICDSDLDYLGRDDFFIISRTLYREFIHYKIVNNELEWLKLQINFLSNHTYFTNTSRLRREEKKLKHLNLIKEQYQKINQ